MPLPGEESMSKLSPEKRSKVILVSLITLSVIAALWFGLIHFQQQTLLSLADRKLAADQRIKQIEADLAQAEKKLADLEDDMASGDLHSWMYDMIRKFKLGYKVDLPQFSQVEEKEMNLFAKYPYKQATMTVGGTAHFHDLGKFVADFENQFPQMRLVNLDLEPSVIPADREKISFKMEIVALVKPR